MTGTVGARPERDSLERELSRERTVREGDVDRPRGPLEGCYVAVVGPGDAATEQDVVDARRAGSLLATRGATVLTGGLGGVMAAAAAGASAAGGVSVGLLPGDRREAGSPDHTVLLALGLGEVRNALLVRCADGVLAIGGSWGTLSEVALARRGGLPVVMLRGWQRLDADTMTAPHVEAAVDRLTAALGACQGR